MDRLSFLCRTAAGYSRIPADQISGDTTFEQLGMDSYAVVDFMLAVEQKYGIVIPDDKMLAARSLNDVLDLICSETTREEN